MKINYPKTHAVVGVLNIVATVVCALAFNYIFAIACSAIAAFNLALWQAAK